MNIDHAHDALLIVIAARVCIGDGRREPVHLWHTRTTREAEL
ncbi:hypothetical protein [Streptomyces tardus]|nr:hypothetical protein [Streptomyces tardus]